MREEAKQYFLLGDRYFETAKLLLKTIITHRNTTAGVDKSLGVACRMMENNVTKSDVYLFIPAIFNCLQGTELFIKGLLLLNGENFKRQHEIEGLLDKLEKCCSTEAKTYSPIKDFYVTQISIIEKYKQTNRIYNSHDLYMSLRYPEITLKTKEKITVNYVPLMYNGQSGIEQCQTLLKHLDTIKQITLDEYHQKNT